MDIALRPEYELIQSMEFFSQYGEDRWIVEHLNIPDKGVFIEIGAFNGVNCSNTIYFEKKGWTGLLVEADPENASRCYYNRKCQTVHCAVSNDKGFKKFFVNPKDHGLSGLIGSGEEIKVETRRAEELISLLEIDHIHIASIDIEGTELDAWKSFGMYKDKVSILIIEYNTSGLQPNDNLVISTLTQDGFKEVHRTPCNLIFTRS